MKLYVTRHGQVADDAEYFDGDAALPVGEVPLSKLGREQATLLGKFLAKRNFRGKILASPLIRTMETAELIAMETGATIYPTEWAREHFGDQDFIDTYQGSTIDDLKKMFPHVAPDATLKYPWWSLVADTHDSARERVVEGVDKLIAEYKDTDEEFLFVAHGASAGAANIHLNLKRGGILWNCCIGMYDSKHPEKNYGKNISFLPGQMVTGNARLALSYEIPEDSLTPYGIKIPEAVMETDKFKLLHIGDTHSATYMFYKQLIRLVKPDVIIHTGDTADEDKVSRDLEARDPYRMKVKMLSDILKDAKCPVYWIPGNNDLTDEIPTLAPDWKIVQPDTVLEIEGATFCVTHSFDQITKKADYYLYGHGCVGENREHEMTLKGGDGICLNNMWSIHVMMLPEREIYHIETPD